MNSGNVVLAILEFVFCFVLPISFLALWYHFAKKDNILCRFLRAIWNFWCIVFSIIPFIGWIFARLIITTNKDEENAKRAVIEDSVSERADVLNMVANEAERSLREDQAKRAAEEEAARQREVEVYKESYYNDGTLRDRERMKVNRDGDMYYDSADGEWHRIKK